MSVAEDNGIIAYLVPTEEDSTKYIAYIQADGKISANANMSSFFRDFSELETIENMSILDTSNVTNMSNMFFNCSSLTTLNLSNWNVSSVTSIDKMFYNILSSIQVTVSNNDMKQWVIEVSTDPKFTEANIILV